MRCHVFHVIRPRCSIDTSGVLKQLPTAEVCGPSFERLRRESRSSGPQGGKTKREGESSESTRLRVSNPAEGVVSSGDGEAGWCFKSTMPQKLSKGAACLRRSPLLNRQKEKGNAAPARLQTQSHEAIAETHSIWTCSRKRRPLRHMGPVPACLCLATRGQDPIRSRHGRNHSANASLRHRAQAPSTRHGSISTKCGLLMKCS